MALLNVVLNCWKNRPIFTCINFDGVGVGAHTRKQFSSWMDFSKALAERDDIKLGNCRRSQAIAMRRQNGIASRDWSLVSVRICWLPTGTPTPNAPTEAYGLAKLINNALGQIVQPASAKKP